MKAQRPVAPKPTADELREIAESDAMKDLVELIKLVSEYQGKICLRMDRLPTLAEASAGRKISPGERTASDQFHRDNQLLVLS